MATGASIAIELEPRAPPTLDDLVRVTGVPLQKLDKPCSDEHLRDISSDLICWQELAPYLGLKEAEVEVIEVEAKTVQERRSKALRKWKNKFSFKATYRVLMEALLKCHMADLVEKVCRLLVADTPVPRDNSKPAHGESAAVYSTADNASTSSYTSCTSDVSVLEVPTASEGHLFDEIRELERKYDDLVDEVEDRLAKAGTDLSQVKRRIVRLPVLLKHSHPKLLQKESRKAIQSAEDINELFSVLHNEHWDFLNCELLCHIVDRFGNLETKESKEKYLEELRRFRTNTKLRDLIRWTGTRYAKSLPIEKDLVLKMGDEWRERTLEDLEQFRIDFSLRCFVNSYAMQFRKGEPGCIAVTFALPTSVDIAALCLQDLREFLKQHGVLRIIADGSCILDTTDPKVGVEQSSPRKEKELPQVLSKKTTTIPTLSSAEEIGIIGSKFVFLAEKLPLDDIAPKMLEKKLVTAREYAGYHIKKTAPEKSEYLLECLKRRPGGSLKIFCDILREVEPAAHLAELLDPLTVRGMNVISETEGDQTGSKQEDLIALEHDGIDPQQQSREDVEQPLSETPVFTLYNNMVDIKRLLDVESVCPYLMSAGCITTVDVEHLKTFQLSKDLMIVEFAYLISKKRGRGLRAFMTALEQSSDHPGHRELLTILQQSIRRHRERVQHIEVLIVPPMATQDPEAEGESSPLEVSDQQQQLASSPFKHTKKNVFTVPMLIQALRRLRRKMNPWSGYMTNRGRNARRICHSIGTCLDAETFAYIRTKRHDACDVEICCGICCDIFIGVYWAAVALILLGMFIVLAVSPGPTLIITGSIELQDGCNLTADDNSTETISLSSLSIYSVLLGVSYLSLIIVVVSSLLVLWWVVAHRDEEVYTRGCRWHFCCSLLGVLVGLWVICTILTCVSFWLSVAEFDAVSNSGSYMYNGNGRVIDECITALMYFIMYFVIGIGLGVLILLTLILIFLYCILYILKYICD